MVNMYQKSDETHAIMEKIVPQSIIPLSKVHRIYSLLNLRFHSFWLNKLPLFSVLRSYSAFLLFDGLKPKEIASNPSGCESHSIDLIKRKYFQTNQSQNHI